MAKRMRMLLLLALLLLLLLVALYLLLDNSRELTGDGIYFIREDTAMSIKNHTEHPSACLFGGGGNNVPGDRETRMPVTDTTKESRG